MKKLFSQCELKHVKYFKNPKKYQIYISHDQNQMSHPEFPGENLLLHIRCKEENVRFKIVQHSRKEKKHASQTPVHNMPHIEQMNDKLVRELVWQHPAAGRMCEPILGRRAASYCPHPELTPRGPLRGARAARLGRRMTPFRCIPDHRSNPIANKQ